MKSEPLITMANQIGAFFASMPERDEALAGIADHIRRFWEPRMRRTLIAALDTQQQAFHALVLDALVAYRAELEPAHA